MRLNWSEQLSNWNPQLVRELRGRLTVRNLLLTLVLAIACQLCIHHLATQPLEVSLISDSCQVSGRLQARVQVYKTAQAQQQSLAKHGITTDKRTERARIDRELTQLSAAGINHEATCPPEAIDPQWRQDWQRWQADRQFRTLGLVSLSLLLVGGTHLLIEDLGREAARGTLSFLRLSPRSGTSILLGKLLGVPGLFYLGMACTLPWQWYLGSQAGLPAIAIAILNLLGLALCLCCHSGAILFGLVASRWRGLQAWLGSGAIALLFVIPFPRAHGGNLFDSFPLLNMLHPVAWGEHLLASWNPHWETLTILRDNHHNIYYINNQQPSSPLAGHHWYHLPLDAQALTMPLLVFGICTFLALWLWQGSLRRFHQPHAPLWTRRQSYWGLLGLQAIAFGFAGQQSSYSRTPLEAVLFERFIIVALLLFSLSLLISPSRATLIEWARYRHQQRDKTSNLGLDLLGGDRSPATVALWLHLAIALSFTALWLFSFHNAENGDHRTLVYVSCAIATAAIALGLGLLQLATLSRLRRILIAATFGLVPLSAALYWNLNYSQALNLIDYPWLLSPWLWLGLGATIAGLNLTFALWLRRLGQSTTRSLLQRGSTAVGK